MGIICHKKTKTTPTENEIKMDTHLTTEPNFVFTRYLYEKDEVKLALLIALLNKKEEAIFWAYELY